jgi:hypothetical protein
MVRRYTFFIKSTRFSYLATLEDYDLGQILDLSSYSFGQQTMGWFLSNMVPGHVSNHYDDISRLKGLQGYSA